MRRLKRIVSTVLLLTLVCGLMPALPVYAETQLWDTPYHTNMDWAANLQGENLDIYLTKIKNWDAKDANLNSIRSHTDRYDVRFKGLVALSLSNEDVTATDSEYMDVISLAFAGDAFKSAREQDHIYIGGNEVNVDLNSESLFLRDKHFIYATTTPAEENVVLKYQAMALTAGEFVYYATTWRETLNEYLKSNGGIMSLETAKALESFHEVFLLCANGNYDDDEQPTNAGNDELFEWIVRFYQMGGSHLDWDYSLQELYERSKDMRYVNTDDTELSMEPDYDQPLTDFYTVNYADGISSASIAALAGVEAPVADDIENTSVTNRGYVTIGSNVMQGVAYSASYIPLQTNMYSTATINGYDDDWLKDWHYKYGFMRKALLYDTSATAAMDYYNTMGTTKGNTRVCTLREFLELGDKDLVLYLDENFYNAEEAKSQWYYFADAEESEIAALVNNSMIYSTSYNGVESDEDILTDGLRSYLSTIYGIDVNDMSDEEIHNAINKLISQQIKAEKFIEFEAILKTGDYTSYSDKLRRKISNSWNGDYIRNAEDSRIAFLTGTNNSDLYVMRSAEISDELSAVVVRKEAGEEDGDVDYEYVTYSEYTPMFSFAYVSAIYRNSEDYKVSNLFADHAPVFIASDDVAQLPNSSLYDKSSLLNYALVRNLNSMVQIDYAYSMDMDAPVYMDIYGNILTESGLVIIPAACNATLYPCDYCTNMFAIGLFSCYGNDYYVPGDFENVSEVLDTFFDLDEDNNVWVLSNRGVTINNVTVDFSAIRAYANTTYNAITDAFKTYILSDGDNHTHVIWPLWVNIINEVMRGAPLESIDADAEGLSTSRVVNKSSVVAAAKLEQLINSLKGSVANTLISIPDFNTMEHSEYVVAFLLKILIVFVTIIVIYQIYFDATAGLLGFRTFFKAAWAIGLTVICVTAIPALFELTYYGANKLLLQNEATKICMYNLEKSQSGIEVGVTSTEVPDTHNKLMVQLDWIDVPWYMEVRELLFGESLKSVDIAREYARIGSPATINDDVIFYNDGVYMDVEDIFNSVSMDYTFNVGENSADADTQSTSGEGMTDGLYLYANNSTQTLGFYSPYYAFLEALTANVNLYNYRHNHYMYTTKTQSGSRLKTVGLSSAYFQSESFMELDPDILHLYEIYDIPKESWYDTGEVFFTSDMEKIRQTAWYNSLDRENLEKRIKIVNDYCKDFVAENRVLLDKVTDETFIKVMALSTAMKYNQVFGITEASCFEIYNMDSNDLLRLSLAKTDDAMLTSPCSYARYVLTIGGEPAVYAAAILVMVMYIGSFIKPLCVLVAYVSVFMSVFVFKVMLRKKNNSLLGYLVTILLLGATNFLHAIILKISTYLPSIGISMLGCIIGITLLQIAYLIALGLVVGHAMRYWQDLGANDYIETAEALKYKLTGRKDTSKLNANVPRYDNNWDYYTSLVEQNRERNTGL